MLKAGALMIICLLLSTPVLAQQQNPIDAAIKSQLGELTFNNTIMATELQRLTEENKKLKAQLEELKKANGGGDAKQKP